MPAASGPEMTQTLEEPSIPPRVQRPLAAVWISLGLHAALIAGVQIVPREGPRGIGPVIEARLVATPHEVSAPAAAPADVTQTDTPRLIPAVGADAIPTTPEPVAPVAEPADSPAASGPDSAVKEPAAEAPIEARQSAPEVSPADPAPIVLSSPVDLRFYGAREIDVQPRALADIVPVYPAEADRERLSGSVVLELRLEADGRVVSADVVRASPPGVFDAATVEAFEQARFAPAIKDGHPVRAQILIEVTYDWDGRAGLLNR